MKGFIKIKKRKFKKIRKLWWFKGLDLVINRLIWKSEEYRKFLIENIDLGLRKFIRKIDGKKKYLNEIRMIEEW